MISIFLLTVDLFEDQGETFLSEWNDYGARFISRSVLGKPAAKLCMASEQWEDQGWQQMRRENPYPIQVKDLEVLMLGLLSFVK